MSEPKDGGSAFPQLARRGYMLENGTITPIGDGMSLRDYFAAAALMRMMSDCLTIEQIAEEAYRFADAMIEARKGGGS